MIARTFRAMIRPCLRTAAVVPVWAALVVGGCSSLNLFGEDADETYIEGSVEQLYNRGMDLMEKREFAEATKFFNEVDRQHPYSVWAPRSQLMVAYANYQAKDFETARLTIDRFLRLNPAHRDVPYAHYLKALCFFQDVRDTKRDPGPTRAAYEEFTLVAERFPSSKYADDSRRKANVLRDHLVGHEVEVGLFYQGKNQHLAGDQPVQDGGAAISGIPLYSGSAASNDRELRRPGPAQRGGTDHGGSGPAFCEKRMVRP